MPDRAIGRVVKVDSFRLLIEIDDNLKGLHKNSFHGLFEIAKINSYIIIPVNDEKIVALVTRINISDITETEAFTGSINLPKSKRYIVATMVGTISGSQDSQEYIQGVYNFPILDNPVWYVMEEDLSIIFDEKKKEKTDYEEDYFLPIGHSPIFNDFEVKINPDKFFCKHSAILGNTGSGKSCTVSTILQSLLTYNYCEDKFVENANIIIFDTNGEYKSAFRFEDSQINSRINAFTIEEDGLKIPYWFMNYDEFAYLFKPSENVQAPILKRSIELAKNNTESIEQQVLPSIIINTLNQIIELCEKNDWSSNNELGRIIYQEIENLKKYSVLKEVFNFEKEDYVQKNNQYYNDGIKPRDSNFKLNLSKDIYRTLERTYEQVEIKKIKQGQNIDIPIYFNFQELISKYIDEAVKEQKTSNNKINEYLSTLRLRLSRFYSDERFRDPFLLDEAEGKNLLYEFIQYFMGCLTKNNDIFAKYKFKQGDMSESYANIANENSKNQITIVDMSLLPYEVIDIITGLIGRITLEFLSRLEKAGIDRGTYPTVIVLEEAQNYIPERDSEFERISTSKKVFERIAREGRKFGLSLMVSSQRPSELSKTVLSQCNTFVIHRLQNPEDQKYIRQMVSSANEDILDQLPILPQQHAIIMGDAVRSPMQIKLREVNPEPKNQNPKFIRQWLNEDTLNQEVVKDIVDQWIEQ